MTQEASPQPPKKGMSGLAIAGIGCGGLFLLFCIFGGMLAMKGCSKVVGDFQKNPAKTAATWAIKANPDLELVSTDDAKGEITIKNKKTGEVTTMSFDQINQGKFTMKDGKGNETSIDGSAGGQGKMTIKGPDGETVIGGNAAETAAPGWIPAYPGAAAKAGGMRTEKSSVISGITTAESTDAVGKVKDFYEAKLKAAGFQVETNSVNVGDTDTAVVNGTKEDGKQKANVMITGEKGKTTITVSYEGPK